MRSRVDFPAPDRPTTPTKDPGGISRETSSTADFTPKRRLTRSKISIDRPKRSTIGPTRSLRSFRDGAERSTVVPRRPLRDRTGEAAQGPARVGGEMSVRFQTVRLRPFKTLGRQGNLDAIGRLSRRLRCVR